jgi:outer membrane immunogenic protein
MNRLVFVLSGLVALAAGQAMAAEATGELVPGAQLAQVAPAPPPLAYDWTGFYLGVNAGAAWGNTDWTYVSLPAGPDGPTASHKISGPLAGATIGFNWQFAPDWVAGVEADLDWAKIDGFTGCPNPAFNCRSRLGDFHTARVRLGYSGLLDRLLLYATGGAASSRINISTLQLQGLATPPSGTASNGSSSRQIGWTAGLGAEYAPEAAAPLSFKLEWLHYDLGLHNYNVDNPDQFFIRVAERAVRLGVTYLFGAPPPAPPMAPAAAAPPPEARKVFMVFFDWDRDTITPEGMAIVRQAADAYKSGAPVRIMVTGYTDRSGSAGYNQRLSERRANNVAKALASLGVPKTQMAVSGRGENDNRVPTADGVREPQNRRVEITDRP